MLRPYGFDNTLGQFFYKERYTVSFADDRLNQTIGQHRSYFDRLSTNGESLSV